MFAIVRPFVAICLLRLAPQDLPASSFLLAVTAAAYAVLGVLISSFYYPLPAAAAVGVTGTALLALFTLALLYARGTPERFVQTLTALAGAGAVLEAAGIPLAAMLETGSAGPGPRFLGLFSTMLWLALLVWSWVVSGHVLRHALAVRLGAGVGISIAFFWLSAMVMHHLFGGPPPSAPGAP